VTTKPRKPPPSDLKARGKALWRNVFGTYVLDPAETALLHELCRAADELDALTAAMADESPVVEGPQGQPRPHPLLAEIRQHRRLAETLAVALALPVDGETIGHRRSNNARTAHMRGGSTGRARRWRSYGINKPSGHGRQSWRRSTQSGGSPAQRGTWREPTRRRRSWSR
jgi:hypothetical protein